MLIRARAMLRRRVRPRRGTSLVEVVVVLVVIGTVAAIAQPRYATALARYRADSAARRIIADLAAARQRARATGVPQAFVVHVASDVYWTGDAEILLDAAIDPNTTPEVTVVRLAVAPYHADIHNYMTAEGGSAVTFDAYGTASSDVLVLLRSNSSEYRWIALEADTGRATSWSPGDDDDEDDMELED
ncbi:MAG: GspH/FimT family pseudopilin [Planctomycetota bacterium]|jgi:prepilin-type N-terminal cleavage/methylation domain-containing protein